MDSSKCLYELESVETSFEENKILTSEMLAAIYDYPRVLWECITYGIDNCIVSGLIFINKQDEIFLTPGIVKFEGNTYFLHKEINLTDLLNSFSEKANVLNLCLVASNDVQEKGTVKKKLRISCIEAGNDSTTINLGTYNWATKKILWPQKIEDLYEKLKMDILEIPYASRYGLAYHPLALSFLRNELLVKKNKDMLDFNLLMQLSNSKVVTMDALVIFLQGKGIIIPANDKGYRRNLYKEVVKGIRLTKKYFAGNCDEAAGGTFGSNPQSCIIP